MEKKKVGIVTYHGAYNYGSFLQAYALQQTLLNRYDVECVVINYRKAQQKDFYSAKKRNNSIRNIAKNLIFIPYRKRIERRNQLFENMINSELILSLEYNCKSELTDMNEKYDLLISGSDQIWNTGILDFDDVYLLSFAHNVKKASYAASMGSFPSLSENDKDLFKQYLSDYEKISVREESAKYIIESLVEKEIEVTVDPTLLVGNEGYDYLIKQDYLNSKLPKDGYVFFYSIGYNKEMIQRVKRFAKSKKLPVYMVFTGSIKIIKWNLKNVTVIIDASVSDFLYLIKNATYVCSSSFHGTVMSIIFKKNFYVINEYKNKNYLVDARMNQLLTNLSLEKRMINDDFMICPEKVDYNNVQKNLAKYTKQSFEFLDNTMRLI